jgi:hypothetical protein
MDNLERLMMDRKESFARELARLEHKMDEASPPTRASTLQRNTLTASIDFT